MCKITYQESLDPVGRGEHGVASGVVQPAALGDLHVRPNHAHQVIRFWNGSQSHQVKKLNMKGEFLPRNSCVTSGPKKVPMPLIESEVPFFMTGSDHNRSDPRQSLFGSKGRLKTKKS